MQADLFAALGAAASALGIPTLGPPADASAIAVRPVWPGEGSIVTPGDLATVHFVVRTAEGKELANSFKRGMPYTVEIGTAVTFWTTALEGLRVGGTNRLSGTSNQFFGKAGVLPIIPPDVAFIADVKLLKVEKAMVARKAEPPSKIGQG